MTEELAAYQAATIEVDRAKSTCRAIDEELRTLDAAVDEARTRRDDAWETLRAKQVAADRARKALDAALVSSGQIAPVAQPAHPTGGSPALTPGP